MDKNMDEKKLMASIENYQETMVDAGHKWDGRCHAKAMQSCYNHQSKGRDVRIGLGTFDGRGHAWCEYKKDGKWLLEDNSIWYINNGSPIEKYGDSYKVKSYYSPDYTKDA